MTSALTNQRQLFKAFLTQLNGVSDDVTRKIGPLDFTLKKQMVKLSEMPKCKSPLHNSHVVSTLNQLKLSPTSEVLLKTFHRWLASQGLACEFNIFTTYKSTPTQNILYEELYRPVGCRIIYLGETSFFWRMKIMTKSL